MRYFVTSWFLIESVVTWTLSSSVDAPVDGYSYSSEHQAARTHDGSSSHVRTHHDEDLHHHHDGRREDRLDFRSNKWQESVQRFKKLQELQEKFADIEKVLTERIGTMKRHLSWKTPSLSASECQDKQDENSDIVHEEGSSWASTIGAGTLYVRWGSKTCPGNAGKVYEGIVGGAWSLKQGQEIDSQCIPNDPSFPVLEKAIHPFYPDDVTEENVSRGEVPLIYHGMPCVVCRVTFRPEVRVVIGKPTCTSDWTIEYAGALMTTFGNNGNGADLLCVDKVHISERDTETKVNNDSENAGFDDKRWTCAVCTK